MKTKYIKSFLLFLLLGCCISVSAQNIQGVVTDSLTNDPIPYLSVFYEGKGVGSITDNDGHYKVETRKGWNKLTFSAVGYVTKVVNIIPGVTKNLNVRMRPDDIMLDEVVVKPKREKYSRKNNPAVELMKKVIAHKNNNKLSENDYYQYNKYQKITMSLNDVTPEMLEKGMYKKMPFLKDQIELCEETNKFILPISVDETASQKIYRKHPKSEKTIIKGMSSTGVNELFATGDMLSTVLKDVFTDVNIYDNDIRLLQYPFISPISSSDAISFYKFYIMDTTFVDKDKCFHLTFVPNNSQDFGFTGHLYVLADSSYTVKKCTMNLPKKSGVNFVDNMDIIQEFEQLPNGECGELFGLFGFAGCRFSGQWPLPPVPFCIAAQGRRKRCWSDRAFPWGAGNSTESFAESLLQGAGRAAQTERTAAPAAWQKSSAGPLHCWKDSSGSKNKAVHPLKAHRRSRPAAACSARIRLWILRGSNLWERLHTPFKRSFLNGHRIRTC